MKNLIIIFFIILFYSCKQDNSERLKQRQELVLEYINSDSLKNVICKMSFKELILFERKIVMLDMYNEELETYLKQEKKYLDFCSKQTDCYCDIFEDSYETIFNE
jgi:hypothetical protein